jgi:hypothetical protein
MSGRRGTTGVDEDKMTVGKARSRLGKYTPLPKANYTPDVKLGSQFRLLFYTYTI